MRTRRLSVLPCLLLLAGYVSSAAADWRFEERPGPGGAKIYVASAGSDMALECGPGGASLWIKVQLLGWREIKSLDATLGFEIKKKGPLGMFGTTQPVLVTGRYDPPSSPTVTTRVQGNEVLELAKKLAGADEMVVTVEPKSASLMPTRAQLKVSLVGAGVAIGELIKRCGGL